MRARDLHLSLVEAPGVPLGQRIVLTLQQAILEGRLLPGTALPGSRVLADMLDVNRRTAILALQELEAQGWLVMRPYSGTFVADELPSGQHPHRAPADPTDLKVGFDLPSCLQSASTNEVGALLLGDGVPDPRIAPAEELAKGYQRALRRNGPQLLEDRNPLGTPLLRETVAAWVSERHGLHVGPERILITRGSRGALALVAGALFKPGSIVAVENPGNRAAWEVLRHAGDLDVRPVAVDAEGLDPAALEELLLRERVRLLYLTPRRQFPTTTVLSSARKATILGLAAAHRVAVLEDDYDGEFHYDQVRPEPLLSMDRTGQVIHLGSLSRLLAPGLRLGYVVLPAALVPFMGKVKRSREEQGDPILEWALADLIRDGELAGHLRRARKIYMGRRDMLVGLLRERFQDRLEVLVPSGGMSLWLRVLGNIDAEAWIQAARGCGLVLNPPSHFFMGPAGPYFRMGFAQAAEAELVEAVRRLEAGLGTLARRPG